MVSYPGYTYLSGPGFLNYAEGFDKVNAYATAGGADKASLFDSPGNDVLFGRSNQFVLDIPGTTQVQGQDFAEVEATSGTGDRDTLDVCAVDYLFRALGTWENQLPCPPG